MNADFFMRTAPNGCVRSRLIRPWPSALQLVGFVVHLGSDLADLVAVLTGMVRAEQQLATGLEFDAQVGLCAAAVAAITSRQRGGTGCGCSGHFSLVSFPSVSGST